MHSFVLSKSSAPNLSSPCFFSLVWGICSPTSSTPIFVGYFFGRKVLKIHLVLLLGGITGSMTSGGSFSVATQAANSSLPSLGYTGSYAFANVLLTIAGSIILFF